MACVTMKRRLEIRDALSALQSVTQCRASAVQSSTEQQTENSEQRAAQRQQGERDLGERARAHEWERKAPRRGHCWGRAEGRVLPEREARGAAGANRVRIESGHWLLNGGRQPPNRPTAQGQLRSGTGPVD